LKRFNKKYKQKSEYCSE